MVINDIIIIKNHELSYGWIMIMIINNINNNYNDEIDSNYNNDMDNNDNIIIIIMLDGY